MLDKFGRGVDVKMKGVLLQWARLGSRRSSSASATCSRIDEHHCILPYYCTQEINQSKPQPQSQVLHERNLNNR